MSKRTLVVTVGATAVLAVVGLSTVEVGPPPSGTGEAQVPGTAPSVTSPTSRARRGRLDTSRLGSLLDRIRSRADLREAIEDEREQVEIRRAAVERITAQIEALEGAAEGGQPRRVPQRLEARRDMATRALEMHSRRLAQLEELLDDPDALTKLLD